MCDIVSTLPGGGECVIKMEIRKWSKCLGLERPLVEGGKDHFVCSPMMIGTDGMRVCDFWQQPMGVGMRD